MYQTVVVATEGYLDTAVVLVALERPVSGTLAASERMLGAK